MADTTVDVSQLGSTPDQSTPVDISSLDPQKTPQLAENVAQYKYGSPAQQALAGAEAFARNFSLGASDWAEKGLAAYDPKLFGPEAIRGREEANPVTSFASGLAGGAGLIGLTGGLAAPLETGLAAKGVGATTARILGYGAEGALFGAGNIVSDTALGDHNLNASQILMELGMSGALGAGLGLLSTRVGLGRQLAKGNKQVVQTTENALPATLENPVIEPPKSTIPRSLSEMADAVEDAKFRGIGEELPQKAEAMEAAERLNPELGNLGINQMQLDSLNSQDARNEFKTMLDVPGKNGEILRNYQGAQKKELINVLNNTINSIAPGYEATSNAIEAGERAADSFTRVIEQNREALGPAFEALKNTPLDEVDHLPGVIEYLTEKSSSPYANPKLANMFDTLGDELKFKPYTTSMGIDQATYRAVKQAVESLSENPKNFEQLRDIRKGLSQNVDVTKLGDAPSEIASAKAAMMDYMQDAIQSQEPDMAVRDIFRQWAINEQNAQFIEKKLGAEIGSGNFRSLAKGQADEQILRKIFNNSEVVNSVKEILPPEDFNKLVADYLKIKQADATDKGVFSSNKFYSQLRKNASALETAFANSPQIYQKLKDNLSLLRIFADDAPQNPSGTTKTFLQALAQGGVDPMAHIRNLMDFGKEKFAEQVSQAKINAALAGTKQADSKLSTIQGVLKRTKQAMDETVVSLLSGNLARGALLAGGARLTDQEYQDLQKNLSAMTQDPNRMTDHLTTSTTHLYDAAPNITQGLTQKIAQATQFLNSKLPGPVSTFPLSPQFTPNKTQRDTFEQFYQGVNHPLDTIKKVGSGMLSNENLEALEAIHPELLDEFRAKLMSEMTPEKLRVLPYATQLGLAKLFNQPMDENMSSMGILSNQMALQAPPLSAQVSGRRQSKRGLEKLRLNERSETQTARPKEE
jgi:hypothetical protein